MSETSGIQYKVVVNHEGQHSIWLAHQQLPKGWTEAGKEGTKEECLSFIEEVWTDIRPFSLRQRLEKLTL